ECPSQLRLGHVYVEALRRSPSPVVGLVPSCSVKDASRELHQRMQRTKFLGDDDRVRGVGFEGHLFCYWSRNLWSVNDRSRCERLLSRRYGVIWRERRQRSAPYALPCCLLRPIPATWKWDLESLAILGEPHVRNSESPRDGAD